MKSKIRIIKIGGNIIDNDEALDAFLNVFADIEGNKILVHGGGKSATILSQRLGLEVKMINGRRITDADTLEIITMMYAGKINKTIVAKLQAYNTNAIGMSGADANSIISVKRPVAELDYGLVGDIKSVNSSMISLLIQQELTPVFCAITHDANGQLLNTNADTIASELAIGLSNDFDVELIYCFEKKGVLANPSNEDSVIKEMDLKQYKDLKNEGIIVEGMIPKLDNCFFAISNGVTKVCIGSSEMLENKNSIYTTLKP